MNRIWTGGKVKANGGDRLQETIFLYIKIARRKVLRYKSCFSAFFFITSKYIKIMNKKIKNNKTSNKKDIKINNKIDNMRNKDLFETKLTMFETEVKKVGYLIRRNELDQAYDQVGFILEKIGDLRTLLNTEHQD